MFFGFSGKNAKKTLKNVAT